MASEKVKNIKKMYDKLSPAGQDLVKTIVSGKPTGMLKAVKDMQDIAERSGMKISIGFQDGLEHKEVVIAGGRGGAGDMSQAIPAVEERQIPAQEGASGLFSLEELIKNHAASADKLKVELKETRRTFKDSYESNPEYRDLNEKVKAATRERDVIKKQIINQPSIFKLGQKVNDLSFDYKEKKRTLAYLLVDYKEQTGATQLDLFGGEVGEIVLSAKLVKKRGKFKN